MTRWPALVALGCFLIFAAVSLGNALHKGGDFDVFVDAGQRVLDGHPLYVETTPTNGVIGPPFQGVFFVPSGWLARVSPVAAKVTWCVANLIALVAGFWLWALVLPGRRAGAEPILSAAVAWAIVAVLLPAQTNFEHQNMNALLLCLVGAGAYALDRSRPILAGFWFGTAAALKVFPGFVLVYLLVRREWRAAVSGVAIAGLLTMSTTLRYGTAAFRLVGDWLAIHRGGDWPTRLQNQSIYAAGHRAWPESAGLIVAVVSAALAVVMLIVALRRRGDEHVSAEEIALVIALSVLLSPIAWDHYWVLMFPALLALAASPARSSWMIFALAAVLITGPSPLVVGTHAFNVAREYSLYTVAGLLLVAALVWRQLLHREGHGR
jgi:hypothetical protein